MNFYVILLPDRREGVATMCIAARSHQEAVDVLVENKARILTEVFEGLLDDTDAEELICDPEMLHFLDSSGTPMQEITVYELGMPLVPDVADLNDRRRIAVDIQGSLKRQRVIATDFRLDDCGGDQDAEG
jgi:hypothetical protein